MADVVDHYDASAPTYSEQYDESNVLTSKEYPANFFRLKKIKQRVADLGLTSVYELGIGDGSPLAALGEMGVRVAGSDLSEGMLAVARAQFEAKGLDASGLTNRKVLSGILSGQTYSSIIIDQAPQFMVGTTDLDMENGAQWIFSNPQEYFDTGAIDVVSRCDFANAFDRELLNQLPTDDGLPLTITAWRLKLQKDCG